ncbi:MAG: GNAT family N-acetyltransferase [Agathobacter sp.]
MYTEYLTERLVLRVIKPEQAPQVLDFYLRDKELFEKYEIDRLPDFYTTKFQKQVLAFETKMMKQGSLYRFYIYQKENREQIIGTISVHHVSCGYFSSCEIGYKFSSAFHHRGYATEAMKKVTGLVFEELGLHRIVAWVQPDNEPSIRLLERTGFQREGICRDYLKLHGQWTDHAQYSLLSPES